MVSFIVVYVVLVNQVTCTKLLGIKKTTLNTIVNNDVETRVRR